jgi:hypothetical protein
VNKMAGKGNSNLDFLLNFFFVGHVKIKWENFKTLHLLSEPRCDNRTAPLTDLGRELQDNFSNSRVWNEPQNFWFLQFECSGRY